MLPKHHFAIFLWKLHWCPVRRAQTIPTERRGADDDQSEQSQTLRCCHLPAAPLSATWKEATGCSWEQHTGWHWHWPSSWQDRSSAREAQILTGSSRSGCAEELSELTRRERHAVLDRLLEVLRLARVPLHHHCRAQCCAADRSTRHPNSWIFEGLSTIWFTALIHSSFSFRYIMCMSIAVKNFQDPYNWQLWVHISFWERNAVTDQAMSVSLAGKEWMLPVSLSTVRCALQSCYTSFSLSHLLFLMLSLSSQGLL